MKTIIEMAREHQDHPDFGDLGHEVEFLERFAELVRADERERLLDADWLSNVIRQTDGNNTMGAGALAEKIVEAIEARGNT